MATLTGTELLANIADKGNVVGQFALQDFGTGFNPLLQAAGPSAGPSTPKTTTRFEI